MFLLSVIVPMSIATSLLASAATPAAMWTQRIPIASPFARELHAMAYDSARGVTVMYGGLAEKSILYKETWELVGGTQWVKRNPAHTPDLRYGAALTYDSLRGESVLFGGTNGLFLPNETWTWDGSDWTQKHPATSPPGLYTPAMAYDSGRDVVVLFGGSNLTGMHNETWEWDGSNWTQKITTTSPPHREAASMSYDSDRMRIVLFGGSASSTNFADIWEYDENDWVERTPSFGPSGRAKPGLVYDSLTHRTVLFGGIGDTAKNDTWNWDGATGVWIERSPGAAPDGRATTMIYDSVRGASVIFGGVSGENGVKVFKDTWEWNDATGIWTATLPEMSPPASGNSGMAYDSFRGEFVLFGGGVGCCGAVNTGETWTWNGTDSRWSKQYPATFPTVRASHMMTFDSQRGAIVLFGGAHTTFYNDTWEWNGTNWAQKHPTATPSPRADAGFAYDSDRGVAVLFGGHSNTTTYAETWEWDGTNWTQRFPTHFPSARTTTRMVYDSIRHVTVLFGGTTGSDETWEWDGIDWTQKYPLHSPPATFAHGMTFDIARSVIVMFGGGVQNNPFFGSTWEWDGMDWTQITTPTSPPSRAGHGMAYDSARHKTVLFGGNSPSNFIDDTWEYGSPNTPPTITVNNVTLEGNTIGGRILILNDIGNASDTEDGVPSVSCEPALGSVLPLNLTSVFCTATDSGGLHANDSGMVTVVDTTPPNITCPADINGIVGQSISLGSPIASDIVDPSPAVTNDAPIAFAPGVTTVTWTAADASLNAASCQQKVTLTYNFSGFFQPVDNPPVLNVVKAGRGIAVKFSLGGNQGLNIFAAGYPKSQQINCDTATALDDVEETVTVGSSSLSYDSTADQYTYIWKTNTTWTGTCRQLVVRLNDDTDHVANFKFK
jgi:HYR domain